MDTNIYVTVRLTKSGLLELTTTTEKVIDNILYPFGCGRIGVVLMDSKKHLGVEEQAIPILRKLFESSGPSGCGIGDIDWFKTGDNYYVFGWLGPNRVLWHPDNFICLHHAGGATFKENEYQILEPLKDT